MHVVFGGLPFWHDPARLGHEVEKTTHDKLKSPERVKSESENDNSETNSVNFVLNVDANANLRRPETVS